MEIRTVQLNTYQPTYSRLGQSKIQALQGGQDVIKFCGSKIDIHDTQLARDGAIIAYRAYPNQKQYPKLPHNYKDVTERFKDIPLGDLKAGVFVDEERQLVFVAYSGTYNVSEFRKNAICLMKTKARDTFPKALKLFKKVKEAFPEYTPIAVGHSYGGGLAQYVAATYNDFAITYAPAGIRSIMPKLGLSLNTTPHNFGNSFPNIVNYVSSIDPVTKPFYDNIGTIYIIPKIGHSLNTFVEQSAYQTRKLIDPIEYLRVLPTDILKEFFGNLKRIFRK